MTWAISATAWSKRSSVTDDGFEMPLTFRTYWRAAASISSLFAGGSRPRRMAMLRHMALSPVQDRDPVGPGSASASVPANRGAPIAPSAAGGDADSREPRR